MTGIGMSGVDGEERLARMVPFGLKKAGFIGKSGGWCYGEERVAKMVPLG